MDPLPDLHGCDADGNRAASGRPACDPGLHAPESTSLKWGENGELAALDLHHILARLMAHDQEAGLILERFQDTEAEA